jgi:hypothetical protein
VTLEANSILRGGGAQLVSEKSAMGIVAVAALDQPFIDAMMKRPVELLLHLDMAGVAELRLLLFHEELAVFGVVGIVTVGATNVVLQMRGAPKVTVFLAVLMAIEASCANLARGSVFESENLGGIATSFHVGLAGTMAGFASLPCGAALGIERGYKVW